MHVWTRTLQPDPVEAGRGAAAFGRHAVTQPANRSVVVLAAPRPPLTGRVGRGHQGPLGEDEKARPQRAGYLDSPGHGLGGTVVEFRLRRLRCASMDRKSIHRLPSGPPTAIRTDRRPSPGRKRSRSSDAEGQTARAVGSQVEPELPRRHPATPLGLHRPHPGRCARAPATRIAPSTPVSRTSARAALSTARATAKSIASLATDAAD